MAFTKFKIIGKEEAFPFPQDNLILPNNNNSAILIIFQMIDVIFLSHGFFSINSFLKPYFLNTHVPML